MKRTFLGTPIFGSIGEIMKYIIVGLFLASSVHAKEIALTFDDAPVNTTAHFETTERTQVLIDKLKRLNVPKVMVFSNPCKRQVYSSAIRQLNLYRKNGHLIGNHTCTHPRLDDVGFNEYVKDIAKANELLLPLLQGQKYFRFPYLNESNDPILRDQLRVWLQENNYRNGMVSIDNDDYLFSSKLNEAKSLNKHIDYEKVKALFLSHILGAAEFYDDLAVKTIGYSPKHVLLLHEMDATVMFVDSLIVELRARGWKIIGADEAFRDKLYQMSPKSTYANNGVLPQIAHDKTGEKKGYFVFDQLKAKLDEILDL